MHVKTVYICENCNEEHDRTTWIFDCIECGKEICEDCMYGWGTCRECAVGKTNEFLQKRWDEHIS